MELRLPLQASPEFKILSSAGISKIYGSMTICLETVLDTGIYPNSILHTQIILFF